MQTEPRRLHSGTLSALASAPPDRDLGAVQRCGLEALGASLSSLELGAVGSPFGAAARAAWGTAANFVVGHFVGQRREEED